MLKSAAIVLPALVLGGQDVRFCDGWLGTGQCCTRGEGGVSHDSLAACVGGHNKLSSVVINDDMCRVRMADHAIFMSGDNFMFYGEGIHDFLFKYPHANNKMSSAIVQCDDCKGAMFCQHWNPNHPGQGECSFEKPGFYPWFYMNSFWGTPLNDNELSQVVIDPGCKVTVWDGGFDIFNPFAHRWVLDNTHGTTRKDFDPWDHNPANRFPNDVVSSFSVSCPKQISFTCDNLQAHGDQLCDQYAGYSWDPKAGTCCSLSECMDQCCNTTGETECYMFSMNPDMLCSPRGGKNYEYDPFASNEKCTGAAECHSKCCVEAGTVAAGDAAAMSASSVDTSCYTGPNDYMFYCYLYASYCHISAIALWCPRTCAPPCQTSAASMGGGGMMMGPDMTDCEALTEFSLLSAPITGAIDTSGVC